MLCRSLMTLSIVMALSAVTGVRQAQAELAIGASAEEAEVTVGCLFPLNGRGGLYGKDSAVGIRLAFE